MLITSDKYTIGGMLRIPHIALAVILNPLVKSMGSRVGASGPQRWGAGDRPRKLMASTPTTPTHGRAPKRRARVDKKTSGSFVLSIDPCAPLSRVESTSFLK